MLTEERRLRILDQLREKGYVTIKDLMEDLQASRSSIMRDLQELEEQGLIRRVRGGASLVDSDALLTRYNEPAVMFKEDTQKEAKQMICQQALQTIQEGDCIYIDSGTTPLALLRGLRQKNIELVTPNTYLIQKLPLDFTGHVILLGGEFSKKYDTSYGSMTLELLQQFHFDRCFMTANGVDVESEEVTVFDMNIAGIKKEVLKRSKKAYLLIDHSKLKTKAFCTWAKLSQFDEIFVDEYPSKEKPPKNFRVIKEEHQ